MLSEVGRSPEQVNWIVSRLMLAAPVRVSHPPPVVSAFSQPRPWRPSFPHGHGAVRPSPAQNTVSEQVPGVSTSIVQLNITPASEQPVSRW
jgi:hypothetical protein